MRLSARLMSWSNCFRVVIKFEPRAVQVTSPALNCCKAGTASRRISSTAVSSALGSCSLQTILALASGKGAAWPRVISKEASPTTPNFLLTSAEESARTKRKKSRRMLTCASMRPV